VSASLTSSSDRPHQATESSPEPTTCGTQGLEKTPLHETQPVARDFDALSCPARPLRAQESPNWGEYVNHYPVVVVAAALTFSACGDGAARRDSTGSAPTTPSQSESSATGYVKITRVRVFIKDERPQAFVQGELGDGCTALQGIRRQRAANTVDIAVTSVRRGEVCTMIMQFLNEWIPLDSVLVPGEYTVRANAASVTFRLVQTADAALHVAPDPGPLPEPPYFLDPGADQPRTPPPQAPPPQPRGA